MQSVIVGGDGSEIKQTIQLEGEFSPLKKAILSGQKKIKLRGKLKESDFTAFRIDYELQTNNTDIELDLSEAQFPQNDKGQYYVPYAAFQGCTCLSQIHLPENISIIKNNAFDRCNNLTKFIIPKNVYIIGLFAFYDTEKLTYLYIPKSVRTIGERFIGQSGLKNGIIELESETPPQYSILFRDREEQGRFKHINDLVQLIYYSYCEDPITDEQNLSTQATGDDVLDYVHSILRCGRRYWNIVYYTPDTEPDMLRMDIRVGVSKKIHLFKSDDYFENHCTLLDIFNMFNLNIVVPDNSVDLYKQSAWIACDYNIYAKSQQSSIKIEKTTDTHPQATNAFRSTLLSIRDKLTSFVNKRL